MSEIDDIFASKDKPKPTAPPQPSQPKKKRAKSKPNVVQDSINTDAPISKKRSAPETIVDPSSQPANPKRQKSAVDPITSRNQRPRPKDKKDEEQFKDSRGTSQRRKTDEGWAIYKEDELGLNEEGGDTPLCPFDCECCF